MPAGDRPAYIEALIGPHDESYSAAFAVKSKPAGDPSVPVLESGIQMSSKWIWPFELLEKVGEGGMGVVYRARYVGNDRIVAVKLLPDDVAQNPTLVARFERELEILAQLRHPNIVHCFGGTTKSQQHFYAMELVEGGTLAQALRAKGRLSWDYVVEYGIQMCAALQYAHERGIIHRDVKPANFLLTKTGKLKLSDFGLASVQAGQRLTMAGRTAGTFLYMAPEQIRGKPPLSNRTDLYALGCVFFELLTGKPPFLAENPAEVLHKHLKETPPRISTVLLDCPLELDRLVADLLQKDPEQRPLSAAEVERRLQTLIRPSISHVDPLARTPSVDAIPIAVAPLADDEASASDVPHSIPARDLRPWISAIAVLSLLCFWSLWSARSAHVRANELSELALLAATSPGPAQLPALEYLEKVSSLSRTSTEQLMTLVEHGADIRARVAALDVLASHPDEGHRMVTRLLSLERTDPEPTIRQSVQTTREKLQGANPRSSGLWWWLTIAVLGGGAITAYLWGWTPGLRS